MTWLKSFWQRRHGTKFLLRVTLERLAVLCGKRVRSSGGSSAARSFVVLQNRSISSLVRKRYSENFISVSCFCARIEIIVIQLPNLWLPMSPSENLSQDLRDWLLILYRSLMIEKLTLKTYLPKLERFCTRVPVMYETQWTEHEINWV